MERINVNKEEKKQMELGKDFADAESFFHTLNTKKKGKSHESRKKTNRFLPGSDIDSDQ